MARKLKYIFTKFFMGRNLIALVYKIYYAIKYLIYLSENNRFIKSLCIKYNSILDPKIILMIDNYDNLNISEKCYIGANTVINICNCHNTIESKLIIGKNTYIGELNNIRASGGVITIGSNCLISQNVNIICANHSIIKGILIKDQEWSREKNYINIGDDVWIGCGAIILPGVTIGNGAVIAAGSVVTRDVNNNSVMAGIPAVKVKERT